MKDAGYFLLMVVMFWNLENFFDPFPERNFKNGMPPDSTYFGKGDEYTPYGEKHWTRKKFSAKRDLIAKTIFAAKDEIGVLPSIIGFCEVENRYVLNALLSETPLAGSGYRIIHKDSPDRRGIDVALLYREQDFKILRTKYLPERYAESFRTRQILYVKGLCRASYLGKGSDWLDTLHVFVNHWPSKVGGEKKSLPARMMISNIVKSEVDSILSIAPDANIILMGDFNDTPASKPVENLIASGFVNLVADGTTGGTYKYKGRWEGIDQFIISKQMLADEKEATQKESLSPIIYKWLFCTRTSVSSLKPAFLLEEDKKYLGQKIKRTFSGPRFNGGASDHLPIVLKIFSTQAIGKD